MEQLARLRTLSALLQADSSETCSLSSAQRRRSMRAGSRTIAAWWEADALLERVSAAAAAIATAAAGGSFGSGPSGEDVGAYAVGLAGASARWRAALASPGSGRNMTAEEQVAAGLWG